MPGDGSDGGVGPSGPLRKILESVRVTCEGQREPAGAGLGAEDAEAFYRRLGSHVRGLVERHAKADQARKAAAALATPAQVVDLFAKHAADLDMAVELLDAIAGIGRQERRSALFRLKLDLETPASNEVARARARATFARLATDPRLAGPHLAHEAFRQFGRLFGVGVAAPPRGGGSTHREAGSWEAQDR